MTIDQRKEVVKILINNYTNDKRELCIFCNRNDLILSGIYVTNYWNVRYARIPRGEGHLLIIPERHVELFENLNSEEMYELPSIIRKCKECFKSLYDVPDNACQIFIKAGTKAGQTISHLHIHLIPSIEDCKEIAKKIYDSSPSICDDELEDKVKPFRLLLDSTHDINLAYVRTLSGYGIPWYLEWLDNHEYKVPEIKDKTTKYSLDEIDQMLLHLMVPYDSWRDRHRSVRPYFFNQVDNSVASMIKFPKTDQKYSETPIYSLVSSAPLLKSMGTTLQMYMDFDVKLVVNLTMFEEHHEDKKHIKADRYLPNVGKISKYGKYTIKCNNNYIKKLDKYTISTSFYTLSKDDEVHTMVGIDLSGWYDLTSFDVKNMLELIKEMRKYHVSSSGVSNNNNVSNNVNNNNVNNNNVNNNNVNNNNVNNNNVNNNNVNNVNNNNVNNVNNNNVNNVISNNINYNNIFLESKYDDNLSLGNINNNNSTLLEVNNNTSLEVKSNNVPNGNMLIHCSAGAGRSGSCLAAYYIYDLFLKGEKDININDIFTTLRMQRHYLAGDEWQRGKVIEFYEYIKKHK